MNLRTLHYFIEIVQQGSITKAAKSLHIAQPPLSQHLIRLESELGVQLIKRQQKQWEITPAGEAFYQYAVQTVKQSKDIRFYLQEIEEGTVGSIRIGVASSCYQLLLDGLANFHEEYPKVKIIIHTGMSHELIQQLKKGELDLALILKVEELYGVDWHALTTQKSIAIMPQKMPLENETVEIKHWINNQTFILLGSMEGHSFTEQLKDYFIEQDCVPEKVIECRDVEVAMQLVGRGMGIAIIPEMELNPLYKDIIKVVEISDFDYEFYPVITRLNTNQNSTIVNQIWNNFIF
jgi:LysR family transcriptional regulator, salicylic acid-responsive activator of bsdBCD